MKPNPKTLIGVLIFLLTLLPGQAFYNPSIGRWLSRDPIGERGSWNLYAFNLNNSVSHTDPLGLCDPSACCVADFDLVSKGKFQGGKTILDYYPSLKGDSSLPSDPSMAGEYNNGKFAGVDVQMVSQIEGPGEKCHFTQTYFAAQDVIAGKTQPDQGKTVDDIKNSGHDESKEPFRQYLDGNPSMADSAGVTPVWNTAVEKTFTTCLHSEQGSSCKYKKCCVEWRLIIIVKPTDPHPMPVLKKVKKWCE